MTPTTRLVATTLTAVLFAAPGRAQPAGAGVAIGDWTHGTIVSAAVGAAWARPDNQTVAGAAFGWELTPRLMLEGSGLWLDGADSAGAFNAALKVRAGIRQAGVSPFVEGGFGLYRMTSTTPDTLPDFYRNRMTPTTAPSTSVTFTDPSWHAGAGLNLFLSRHVAIQPAVEAIIVVGGGRSYTVGAATVRLVYHFEDHPVTPSRTGR